jgi:hypothetical protein
MLKNFTFDSYKKAYPNADDKNEPICLLIPGLERQPAEF